MLCNDTTLAESDCSQALARDRSNTEHGAILLCILYIVRDLIAILVCHYGNEPWPLFSDSTMMREPSMLVC
jgi:hypothetical protein